MTERDVEAPHDAKAGRTSGPTPEPAIVPTSVDYELGAWLVRGVLGEEPESALLAGVAERLVAAGIPIARASVAVDLLDPVLGGRQLVWRRATGGVDEPFLRAFDEASEAEWLASPFHHLFRSGADSLRCRLDGRGASVDFPLFDALRREGMTDYVAFVARGPAAMAGDLDANDGLVSSWTTDAPEGFTDAALTRLAVLMPTITLAFLLCASRQTARALVTTYLGSDAALRVLAGNIVRGQAETIRAVVWFSDLAGYTRISEAVGPAGTLALLNEYAEVQVEAIEAHGGHVLKFIGDAILAIFPDDGTAPAAARALDAAVDHRGRIAALNTRRAATGLPVTDTHTALHVGDLLYGNVGSPRRLDFTVLGPAVNEAARIESLCGSLERSVIASAAFAEAAGVAAARLVSLGRYAPKGVARPQEMFTLDPE